MKIFKSLSISLCTLAILALISYATVLFVFPFPHESLENIAYSQAIYDKDHNMLRAFTNDKDQWLMPIELDKVNPDFINATIAIEDKRFFKHPGVDAGAVLRAIRLNFSNRRVISGASTISMQVIRMAKRETAQ